MQRSNHRGFTLVELLITLLVASISLMLGVPSFVKFVDKNELSSLSTEIVSTLQDARERAVSHDEPVTITQQAKSISCVYQDNGSDTACDGIDLSGTEVSLTRTGATGDIVFEPSGMTNFDLILTVAHEDIGSHEYEIRILRSGRISLKQKPI